MSANLRVAAQQVLKGVLRGAGKALIWAGFLVLLGAAARVVWTLLVLGWALVAPLGPI